MKQIVHSVDFSRLLARHLWVILLLLLPNIPALAAINAYDGFSTGPGNLNGSNGGFGFSGTWRNTTGNATITSPGMTYAGMAVEGDKTFFDPTGYDAVSYRTLATPRTSVAGTSTWIAFLGQRTNGTSGRRFLGLSLFNGGDGNAQMVLSVGINHPAASAVWRISSSTGGASSSASADTPSLVVARIQWNPSGNETVSLFVNPVPGTVPSTPDAQFTTEIPGFDRLRIGAGAQSGSNTETQCIIDELAIADTYGEAVALLTGWRQVPLGGGGKVTGLITDASGSAIYCRTDIGGAYRWDGSSNRWVQLMDTLLPLDFPRAKDYIGVSSFAIDPNDAHTLYASMGGSAYNGVFSSTNNGATWTQINPSTAIVMDSNVLFVNVAGERLAVDPNNSSRLWFGSSRSGLYKASKVSGTWTWSQVSSTSVPFGAAVSGNNVGVSFVACDPNGGSTIVYVGVYDNVGSTGGIYRSLDGNTWSKVSGATITKPVRAELAANGTLYVTCEDEGVAKVPRGGSASMITPLAGVTYAGVAVAAGVPAGNNLAVAEYSSSSGFNRIWRTTDGGATWAQQWVNMNNLNYFRTEPDGTPSVNQQWFARVSDLLINPTNANELWACDILGTSRTQNAQDLGSTNGAMWYSQENGLEETVVLALRNAPTGPKLMLGVADVGGFRYNDTSLRPVNSGGAAFSQPIGGNWTSFDYYESDPQNWAATWLNAAASAGSGAVSRDGGQNWLLFGELAEKTVTNSPTAGVESWDVRAFVSRQAADGVGKVSLMLCCPRTNTGSILTFDSREAAAPSVRPRLVINGSIVRYAEADASVSTTATTTNYGSDATLTISKRNNPNVEKRWSYLRFDISGIGVIGSAVLELNRQSATNTTAFRVGVYASTNLTWVEGNGGTDALPAGEITWNTRPAVLASVDNATNADPTTNPKYYDGATALLGGRVAISSMDSDRMVWLPYGTSNAARYSADGGVTWKVSTGGPNSMMQNRFAPSIMIQQLASDRVNGHFYLARFNEGGGGKHYVYRSTDGGATFALAGMATGGSSNVYRCQIAAAPTAAGDLWLCDDGMDNPLAGGLWHSTNGGVSWVKLSGVRAVGPMAFGKGSSGFGYSIFINGYYNGVLGVYRTDDYGTTWQKLEDFPSIAGVFWMAGDMQVHGKVYVGTNGRGTFESQ